MVNVTKDIILATVGDLVIDFLYYNRKGDKVLPIGEIEQAIKNGTISLKEITDCFEKELKLGINNIY